MFTFHLKHRGKNNFDEREFGINEIDHSKNTINLSDRG